MEAVLGFQVGFWDYATFAAIFIIVVAGLSAAVFILGLPGRIAIARNHPEADAIFVMGWVGFVAIVPWIQACNGLSGKRPSALLHDGWGSAAPGQPSTTLHAP